MSLLDGTGVEPWKPGVRYRKTLHLHRGGGGARSVILAGIIYFGERRKNPPLTALPPVLVVRGGTDRNSSWLKMTLNAISEELVEQQPASNLVIAKLANLLFMQSLRGYLATDRHNSVGNHSIGWLRGIRDPLVGRAISCMHPAPERRWTLHSLAEEVGSSRAVFAQRFSALVGQGALSYLTVWRMHVAAGLLLDGTDNIRIVTSRWATNQKQPSPSPSSAGPGSHPADIAEGCFVRKVKICKAPRSAVRSTSDLARHPNPTHTLNPTVLMGRNQTFLTSAYNLSIS